MKITRSLAILGLTLGLITGAASAAPILIAYTPAIPNQPGDNGFSTLNDWTKLVVNTYNSNNGTTLPAPPDETAKYVPGNAVPFNTPANGTFDGNTKSITLNVTGLNYILLSWGGGNNIGTGGNGTLELLYYINGQTGPWTFSNAPATGGLSSIHVYGGTPPNTTGVPDGGSTAVMLALGLVGLALGVRRRS